MTNEHQYQIGDKVVVITENSEFKKGDICKIAGKDIFGNAYLKRLSDERITYELMSNFKPYEEGGEKKTDMADTKFKVGDKVRIVNRDCAFHWNDDMEEYLGIVATITLITDGNSKTKYLIGLDTNSWNWSANQLELVSPTNSANKAMTQLKQLTKEQKATLSKEDQALIQLGVIGDDLALKDTEYVLKTLFALNRDAIAVQAIEDVKQIQAEEKAKELRHSVKEEE